jgi:hypothetical protein
VNLRRRLACAGALLAGACAAHPAHPAAPDVSTDLVIRGLVERSAKLESFALHYHVQLPRSPESPESPESNVEIDLRFRAPGDARLVVRQGETSHSTWANDGTLSFRGAHPGAAETAELSLARFAKEQEDLEALLVRELHADLSTAAQGNPGPVFEIELLPPQRPEEHGTYSVTVFWLAHASCRFQWLEVGSAATPWRMDGSELVRAVPGGGSIRVSTETGYVTRMSHPSGFDMKLVSASELVQAGDFVVPPPAPGAKDNSIECARDYERSVFPARRGMVYGAILRAAPDPTGDARAADERLLRVFAALHRPICQGIGIDAKESGTDWIAKVAGLVRADVARADSPAAQRAALATRAAEAKGYYEGQLNGKGDQFAAAIPPLDLADFVPPVGPVAPDRLAALLALERAAFHAEFQEFVVVPSLLRLDEALESVGPDR